MLEIVAILPLSIPIPNCLKWSYIAYMRLLYGGSFAIPQFTLDPRLLGAFI